MRSPPSPTLVLSYPVTGGVGLMAGAVTFMTLTSRWAVGRFEVRPSAFWSEPWRLFTSVLPHLDVFHLVFNVYWLWIFGTLLEEVLGHVRLLGLVALFAAGSMSAQFAVGHGAVGLSGVGYGLFALLWVLSSRDRRFAEAVDARTAQLFALWFVVCVVATYTKIWAVGNVAHGVGAVLGGLVGAAMSARTPRTRLLAAAGVPVLLAASFAGATVLRPRANLSHGSSLTLDSGP
jgi:membrane associated rhomboid family serine protease